MLKSSSIACTPLKGDETPGSTYGSPVGNTGFTKKRELLKQPAIISIEPRFCRSPRQKPLKEKSWMINLTLKEQKMAEKVLAETSHLIDLLLNCVHLPWNDPKSKRIGKPKSMVDQRSIHLPSEQNPLCHGVTELGDSNICVKTAMRYFFEEDPRAYNKYLKTSFRTADFHLNFGKSKHSFHNCSNQSNKSFSEFALNTPNALNYTHTFNDNDDEFILCTLYQSFRGAYGFDGRDLHVSCLIKMLSPSQAVFVSSSAGAPQNCPIEGQLAKQTRAICRIASMEIRIALCPSGPPVPVGTPGAKTYLSFLWQADLNGFIPAFISNSVNMGCMRVVASMRDSCKDWMKKNIDKNKHESQHSAFEKVKNKYNLE